MKIRFAQPQDLGPWMELVEQVKNTFPGLETREALEEHRRAVLPLMEEGSAICAVEEGRVAGALLFDKAAGLLCFLAVSPSHRRRHIGEKMVELMLSQMDPGRDVAVSTYREGDPRGTAARAFYRHLGFGEGRLTEEFGYPVQEFILRR